MSHKLKLLSLFIFFLFLFYPVQSSAVEGPKCWGNWTMFMPLEDTGSIQKSNRISWKAGDYRRYKALPEHKEKLDFIRMNYSAVTNPSRVRTACEKYGPPYYVKEIDLPKYLEKKIKKYGCPRTCNKNVSAITVPYPRDILPLDSNRSGFKVDCQTGFYVNVYCIAPLDQFSYTP